MTQDLAAGAAYVDGAYVPVAEARIPLLDWGFLRSDANQDTISVWKGLIFRLDDHLDRFDRNIEKLRLAPPEDRAARRRIVMELLRLTGLEDAYVQIIATRGRPPVGVRDPRRALNRFYAFCIPYMWIATPEQQAKGLHLIVSAIQRVPPESVDPTLKHYHWLDFEMGLLDAYDRGGDTVVLVDRDGNVTEGPGFNVFAVASGRVVTPDRHCLDGMTRRTVIELCAETNLACEPRPVSPEAPRGADEVFLTSTAGGVVPITRIDGQAVGDGSPGPVTTRLRGLYWQKREAGWHGTPIGRDRQEAPRATRAES
jgi:branched-chain amino acid aminotransferase